MLHLSKTLYHYVKAYKYQEDKEILIRNLDLASREARLAQQYLFEAEHGVFSTWYSRAEPLKRTFQIDSLLHKIATLKEHALKIK